MKKVLSIIFLISLMLFSTGNLKSNKAYALASCPSGTSINISTIVPVTFSAILNFDYDGIQLNNISRVLVSWGDGSTNMYNVSSQNSGVNEFHPYNQVGDFKPYVVLGDNSSWQYICYGPTVAVYYVYNGGFGNVTLRDPAGPTSVTFNANTQFGGDNIIGYYTLGQLTYSGVGGSFDNPVDRAKLTLEQWGTYQSVGGDRIITDNDPNYSSPGGYIFSGVFYPLSLSQRSNLITLRLTRPANTWIYGSIVSSPATSATVNIVGSSGQVYWRPRNVSQSPTPTPPSDGGGCPPGYFFNPSTNRCEVGPTEPPAGTAWTFPSMVYDTYDNRAITNITLKLYGSSDGIALGSELATCSGIWWDLVRCRPTLNTAAFYRWYFVKKTVNPANYTSTRTVCNKPNLPPSPTPGWDLCRVIDANTLRWGGTWGFSLGSKGYYGESEFYVSQIVPTVAATPTPTRTPTPTVTPFIPPQAAWFQTQGGSLMAQSGDIRSPVPSTQNFNEGITNIASAGTLYYSGTISAGSNPGKKVNSGSFPELINFNDLKKRFWSIITIAGDSNITPSDLTAGNGSLGNPKIYAKDANSTISNWNNFSGNAVIFIDGNLTVNQNVTVANGSFLGFVSSGNITLNPQVTNLQGFYLTNGNFSTGTQTPTLDNQLVLSGTFVANGRFSLERNLGNAANNSTPAELFLYRPDFSFTAPDGLRKPYRFWGEETP